MNALIHRIITSILWFIILSSIFSSKLWCSMTKAWVWLRRREDGYKDRKLESRLRGSMAWLGSSLRGLMAWLESPLRGSMDWLGSLLRGTMAWLGFQLSSIMVWLKYARSGVFFFFDLVTRDWSVWSDWWRNWDVVMAKAWLDFEIKGAEAIGSKWIVRAQRLWYH